MSQQIDSLAPHNVEAEEAVLGAILLSPEALLEVLSFLQTDDFFIVRNAWVWETIVALHERRSPIDYLTVASDLEQMGRLEEIGGEAYLLNLISKTPSALNIEGYGRVVEQMAVRRRLISAASRIAQVAHSEEPDIDEVIGKAEQALLEATNRTRAGRLSDAEAGLNEAVDTVLLAQQGDPPPALQTGIATLDRYSLLQKGLIICGGRPGMGKSALWQQVLFNVASRHFPVAYFMLEGSRSELFVRMMSQQSGVEQHKLKRGGMTRGPADGKGVESEEARAMAVADRLKELIAAQKFFLYQGTWTAKRVRDEAVRLARVHGVRLVVIDTLNTLQDTFARRTLVEGVTTASGLLKPLAQEIGGWVVAIAQLSRAVENPARRPYIPTLGDLRESGALEQDADVVMLLWRAGYYVSAGMLTWQEVESGNPPIIEDRREAHVNFAKVRDDEPEVRVVHWDGARLRFTSPERGE